ncbi:hypothetical protein N7G274_003065 [Stereocaulon virgatum]|uniref:Uncharacterized protein n=1 Tax=Stereocaulon virgatum TaxID=373712 RepID=A0ABR4AF09_9LECA
MQSTLPTVTTIRYNVGQGKTISVQEFLRGLKRPVSKLTLPSAVNKVSTNTTERPNADVKQVKTISVYEFLGCLRRPGLEAALPNPINDDTSGITAVHDELQLTRPLAVTLGVLDPPESYSEETIDHTQQHSVPCSEVEKAKITEEVPEDDGNESLEAPRVIRTYVKKARQTSPPAEILPNTSQLFCTQSAAEHEQRGNEQGITSQTKATASSNTEGCDTCMLTGQEPQRPHYSTPQDVHPVDETDIEPTTSSVADDLTEKTTRPRKRRRAPINELALRATRLDDTATLNSRKDHLDSHKGPKSILKSAGIVKSANEANLGKVMTKYRRDSVQSRRNSLNPNSFRFPPTTPKATSSPGWKLGSGFEGISMETLNSTGLASHRRKAKRAKTVRFVLTPLRLLELSTKVSSTISIPKTKQMPKMPRILATPLKANDTTHHERCPRSNSKQAIPHIGGTRTDERTMFNTAHPLTSPPQPLPEGRSHEQPKQFPIAPTHKPPVSKPEISLRVSVTGTGNSQAIQAPSKSECNGWLKRRRRTSLGNADEKGMMLEAEHGNLTDDNDDAGLLFDFHNAVWYGAAQPECIPKPPVNAITSLGLSGVKNSHEKRQRGAPEDDTMLLDRTKNESLDCGEESIHPIREANPNEGGYFSKAVEKPRSTEKRPHSIVRRKSQIQGSPRSSRSQVVKNSLELGMTPRLKKTMSNLPFRPPFQKI